MQKIFGSLIFGLIVCVVFSLAQAPVKKTNSRPTVKTTPKEPFEKATVEEMSKQCVRLETEKGAIEMEMYPESAPETVRNFLNLVSLGAYDTTVFSRVVPNFVVQGGDVATRQQVKNQLLARSQRTIPDELNQIRHERGILSMARSDEPNTASSHFFILVRESAAFLDGKFAAFGRVTRGMETIDAINKMPVKDEKPDNPVRITRAVVFACTSTPSN